MVFYLRQATILALTTLWLGCQAPQEPLPEPADEPVQETENGHQGQFRHQRPKLSRNTVEQTILGVLRHLSKKLKMVTKTSSATNGRS